MRLPIIPMVTEALETAPRTPLTFLRTEYGNPFSAAGFGNWFRDRCDEATPEGCSAHGLRKGFQARGANVGLSDRESMAIAWHESSAERSRYTKRRDRDLLAARGMVKLSGVGVEDEIV
jgi:hypothetical protein